LVDHAQINGLSFSTLDRAVIGGSACPPAMITALARMGVSVRHAWGMTEVSPLGTVCTLLPEQESFDDTEKLHILASQGRPLFGAQFSIMDENCQALPHDGKTTGNLMI